MACPEPRPRSWRRSPAGTRRTKSSAPSPDCLNRTGNPGGDFVWMLRRQGGRLQLSAAARFGLGGRYVADRLEQTTMVEPVDPREGGEFDSLPTAPGPAPSDQLSLEQAVDRLGEGVVVRVADAADGGRDAGLGQALGVLDRQA